jgi:hypothetical protein
MKVSMRVLTAQTIRLEQWKIEGIFVWALSVDTFRYHGMEYNPYPLPNDDEEVVRLDELQFVVRGLYGANVLAPISPKATRIVDVGTGSGRYCPLALRLMEGGVWKSHTNLRIHKSSE